VSDAPLLWPRAVPTKTEAREVLFSGVDVRSALSAPSLRFLARLSSSTRELLASDPIDPAGRLWADAFVAAWRIEMALAMPRGEACDDAALRDLIEDAVLARDALTFARASTPELDDAISETRMVLFEGWGLLLRRTAPPPPVALRAPLKVGSYATVAPGPSKLQQLATSAAVLGFAAATFWLLWHV
jgi:hypothetical protein